MELPENQCADYFHFDGCFSPAPRIKDWMCVRSNVILTRQIEYVLVIREGKLLLRFHSAVGYSGGSGEWMVETIRGQVSCSGILEHLG